MLDYLYDGTFDGFLTCVHEHYYRENAGGIFHKENYQPNLLGGYADIKTDEKKSQTVYQAIKDKISRSDVERVYRVFLSSAPEKEIKLLRYIILGFKNGAKIRSLHGNPIVFDVQQIEKKVTFEVCRLSGLVRFTAIRGGAVLYSAIDPDHDVCELLAGHFCDRFKNDPFIIHDKGRSKALIANGGEWYITEFSPKSLPELNDDEVKYRKMWKKYFDAIAIKERINPTLQRRCMPARYWKNMPEMNIGGLHT